MNAQEYIASGAIEACLTGLADQDDWQELLYMAEQYPEVASEKLKLEMEMEQQHLSGSVAPPPALKQQLFSAMHFDKTEEARIVELPTTNGDSKPAADERPKVVPIVPTPKPVKWLQRALAVSVILLMGSVIINFYFYSKTVTTQKQYNAVETSFNKIKDPSMKPVVLHAMPQQPGSMATVYWDEKSRDVYLLINNLPKPSGGKQYQLWAIVDGKPVDAGTVTQQADTLLIKMKKIPNAQAFAITLEKEGGSPAPSMDSMYVMGEI